MDKEVGGKRQASKQSNKQLLPQRHFYSSAAMPNATSNAVKKWRRGKNARKPRSSEGGRLGLELEGGKESGLPYMTSAENGGVGVKNAANMRTKSTELD